MPADIEDGVSEHGGAMMLPYFDFFAYASSRKKRIVIIADTVAPVGDAAFGHRLTISEDVLALKIRANFLSLTG